MHHNIFVGITISETLCSGTEYNQNWTVEPVSWMGYGSRETSCIAMGTFKTPHLSPELNRK